MRNHDIEPSFRAIPFSLTPACKSAPSLSMDEWAGRGLGFVKWPTGHEPSHDAMDRLRQRAFWSEAMSYKHTAEKLADYRRQIRDCARRCATCRWRSSPNP
jgi:hypothetical protein